MKSPMRSTPLRSMRWPTSTSTSALATVPGSDSPIATIDDSPPSEAPTRAGCRSSGAAMARTSAANASIE